jgi:ubiquitin-conjugating enzyme E2 A
MNNMSKLTINRLTKELSTFQLEINKIDGIIIENPIDLMLWNAKICGPPNSPFENGIFDIVLKFDSDYPIKPPSVKFLTPMFHPNIYRDGKICVDILQGEWTPAQNIRTILLSIISLLMDPNPASPANREASELYVKNYNEYVEKVKKLIIDNNNK